MTPLQTLRLRLGLPVDPTAEEMAREDARYCSLRAATPCEQLALRLRRLEAAGWDAQAHGHDPRRLAGGVGEAIDTMTVLSLDALPDPTSVPLIYEGGVLREECARLYYRPWDTVPEAEQGNT